MHEGASTTVGLLAESRHLDSSARTAQAVRDLAQRPAAPEIADDPQIAAKLLNRISWGRAAVASARGALTLLVDPQQIADVFRPKDHDGPESIASFNEAYKELLALIPGMQRVVVLVDDLARCLPDLRLFSRAASVRGERNRSPSRRRGTDFLSM